MARAQQPPQVPRSLTNLVYALDGHCRQLNEYARRTFAGRAQLYGEIAGKLRILVHDHRSNDPLLLDMMEEFGFNAQFPVATDETGATKQVTIREFLAQVIFVMSKTRDLGGGSFAWRHRIATSAITDALRPGDRSLTYAQFIALYANQYGGAHEDWSLDEELSLMVNGHGIIPADVTPEMRLLFENSGQLLIAGHPYYAELLRHATNAVLRVAAPFLQSLTPNTIQTKEEERVRARTSPQV